VNQSRCVEWAEYPPAELDDLHADQECALTTAEGAARPRGRFGPDIDVVALEQLVNLWVESFSTVALEGWCGTHRPVPGPGTLSIRSAPHSPQLVDRPNFCAPQRWHSQRGTLARTSAGLSSGSAR
jgi:hypothetical protein